MRADKSNSCPICGGRGFYTVPTFHRDGEIAFITDYACACKQADRATGEAISRLKMEVE